MVQPALITMTNLASFSKAGGAERRFLIYIWLVVVIVVVSFLSEVADWADLYQDFINQIEVGL